MRIVLVQPPSNYEETFLLSPPLGLLSVGAAAENEGAEVTLLDFNLKGLQDQRWQTAEYFYPHAVELIEEVHPDIVGFTSMAIESHVCVETARRLKEGNPELITLFGGPHFGAIATEVLEHYAWTDYVIAGEGEAPLQNLIRYLEGNDTVATLDNIAYRDNGEIVFNRRSMSGRDLDEIPFPAYHLVDMDEYFALNPNKLVCFEHARGCYLKCSFCYSPQHWGHGESRKSTERVLAELRQLKEMGIEELFWVSDNLLNSKDNAISLCEAITEAEFRFKWHCYGTMPQIIEPVVEALSSAGCQSIFVGVDAVAEDNKKKYKKSYFKGWEGLREKLSLCLTNGITPTCAFMLSPKDTEDAREATLRVAVLCSNMGCFVRLNALTYYNQTEIAAGADLEIDKEYSEAYAIVLFDTAEILIRNDYARMMPELFPFHRTFIDRPAHEAFAGECRVAMQVTNNHKILALMGMREHDLGLNALISGIRQYFSLDEISCRGLADHRCVVKFIRLLEAISTNHGLPQDLISLNRFSQTPGDGSLAAIDIQVDSHLVSCLIPEYHVISTRLNLDTESVSLDEEKNLFLIQKNGHHISAIRINDTVFQALDSKVPTPPLTKADLLGLIERRALTPLLM